jgi:hypothetical protein
MPKPMFVWSGSAWVSVATEVESLATYATQSYANNSSDVASGLKPIIPSSVSIGSGSSSVSTLGAVSFSGASNVALNGCFSSSYKNYKIVVNLNTTTVDTDIFLRLRNSTTDKSTNYTYGIYGRQISTGVAVGVSGTTTGIFLGSSDPITTNNNGYAVDLLNPFVTDRTIGLVQAHYLNSDTTFYAINGATVQTEAYSADGINLVSTAGSIPGEISVYGYKK